MITWKWILKYHQLFCFSRFANVEITMSESLGSGLSWELGCQLGGCGDAGLPARVTCTVWPECQFPLRSTCLLRFSVNSMSILPLVSCQVRACRSHRELCWSHFPFCWPHVILVALSTREQAQERHAQTSGVTSSSPSFSLEFCLFVCLTGTELRSLSQREWRKGGREHWLWSVTSNCFFMISRREKRRSQAPSLVKWLTWGKPEEWGQMCHSSVGIKVMFLLLGHYVLVK